MIRRIASCCVLACMAACHAGQPAPAAEACELPGIGSATYVWRQVRTRQFTFCVPPGWHEGTDGWWNGQDRVSWSGGSGPLVPFTVQRGRPGRYDARQGQGSCTPGAPTVEIIGGHQVDILSYPCGSRYATSARWRDANVSWNGSAGTPSGAEDQLAIYRTVRLAGEQR